MRCFIAIEIDEEIRASLGELQRRIEQEADIRKGDVKWVRPEAMHLTLKFLGEIKDQEIMRVCNVVREVASQHKSFDLDVAGVGCFGGRSARVVWVGAGHGCRPLLELQADLEEQLAQEGWPKETRKFSGHLTLCRVRNPKAGVRLSEVAERLGDLKIAGVRAGSVTVFQSELRPEGPQYTPLGDYVLERMD